MDISREPVTFQVSMNGFDFDDASKDITFTFVGKASGMGMIMYLILTILLGGLMAVSIYYLYQLYLSRQQNPQI
jgi:hypothetical protein